MRILVHDFAGHPFQVQLSRELSRRGHDVVHSYCAAYIGGKGNLSADASETLVFEAISEHRVISKSAFVKRLFQELAIGLDLVKLVRRARPHVVLLSTTPVPSMMVLALALIVMRTPWVLWHQDIQALAMTRNAGGKLPGWFTLVGRVIDRVERWGAKRAAAVVAIADSFRAVHKQWGTDEKVTVIPNWAPLDEIVPVERKNDWAVEHHLDDVPTLLYSGTLGLKHNPLLLVELARQVRDRGCPVELAVVNEGPAVPFLIAEADRLSVPLRTLPFQPYERLSEVLGSGDILVVLLERDAGEFSVPSKTLSYLSAGRPVLGLMPPENLAAQLVAQAGGLVLPPESDAVPAAADWAVELLLDPAEREQLGVSARALAEREFELAGCADRFERVLAGSVHDMKRSSKL